MSVTWWHPPIPVKGVKLGVISNVNSAERALEFLRAWNRSDLKSFRTAFTLCVEAMSDPEKVEPARKAFKAAARATGNLIAA